MLGFVRSIAVIGLGGIGSWFTPPLARFLHAENFDGDIILADGDMFTDANRVRQDADASDIGRNKADVFARRTTQSCPSLRVRAVPEFITPDNISNIVTERALIAVAVDNHPARALVARHAAELRDVCVLSAGNEKYDGNICIMLRRAGKPLTAHLLDRHPEIGMAKAGNRAEMGCEDLAATGEPQLLVTNFYAAAALLSAFYALWGGGSSRARRAPLVQEIYFDIRQHAMSAIPIMVPANEEKPALEPVTI